MTIFPGPEPSPAPHPGYRACVGMALFDAHGRVFIGKRRGGEEHVDATHAWQMPQGGIDPGEDPYVAALRELYEETNVRSVRLLAEASAWFAYDLPDVIAGRAWKGRYRGQTQKWFALHFTGSEDEINITTPGGGHHKPEFKDWRWEPFERVADLIIPFKRGVYERVIAEFRGLASRS